MKARNDIMWAGAPLAPFKDPFKTRPPMGIGALSITKLNVVVLHVFENSINLPILS